MGSVCDSGRGGTRPHICFEKIKEQLGDEYCSIVYDGAIHNLLWIFKYIFLLFYL